jgi:pimeloyl-ACP methyl ester carboxylesterase
VPKDDVNHLRSGAVAQDEDGSVLFNVSGPLYYFHNMCRNELKYPQFIFVNLSIIEGRNRVAMYYTTEEGHRIWYETSGKGSGVLILHGLGGSIESMRRIAYGIGDEFRKVLIDLPCHGRSDDFRIPLRNLGKELVGLMQENSLENFYGIGLSLGSILLEETILDYGNSLKSAILISPASKFDNVVANKIMGWTTIPGQADVDAFSPQFLMEHRKEIEEYDRENPLLPQRVTPILTEILEFSIENRISYNRVMMLIGRYDTVFGERMIDDLKRTFPNSEYHILDSGHAIHREAPDITSELARRFFNEQDRHEKSC